jgi:hypothetical protein
MALLELAFLEKSDSAYTEHSEVFCRNSFCFAEKKEYAKNSVPYHSVEEKKAQNSVLNPGK